MFHLVQSGRFWKLLVRGQAPSGSPSLPCDPHGTRNCISRDVQASRRKRVGSLKLVITLVLRSGGRGHQSHPSSLPRAPASWQIGQSEVKIPVSLALQLVGEKGVLFLPYGFFFRASVQPHPQVTPAPGKAGKPRHQVWKSAGGTGGPGTLRGPGPEGWGKRENGLPVAYT